MNLIIQKLNESKKSGNERAKYKQNEDCFDNSGKIVLIY